ncbi:low density lipoprotein receptor adapter protein 1-like isoform X2 [Prorops nasuta]|uniref:low density lipoprotein receptor adapter protein 1-like isoform X2 n=1 Tax=Prorops nasuta TaxID=863751 RepID=UPI0034CDE984
MSFFKKIKGFSRHKKLCEEWALANNRDYVESGNGFGGMKTQDGSSSLETLEAKFTLKYLGSTLVETPSSEEATAEAIKTVITMTKASGKKLQRVLLTVSLKGIQMTDLATEEDQLEVSIYRISYCSADATHDHVFAFIATNLNETMECHTFLCPKRKIAQTVALTVAQAFSTAYEAWQLTQTDPEIKSDKNVSFPLEKNNDKKDIEKKEKLNELTERLKRKEENVKENREERDKKESEKNLLIDLSIELKPVDSSWVCFEDESSQWSERESRNWQETGINENNSIPMTSLRTSLSTAVPNAWNESRSIDLVCS